MHSPSLGLACSLPECSPLCSSHLALHQLIFSLQGPAGCLIHGGKCVRKMNQWRGCGIHRGPPPPGFTPRPKSRASSLSCVWCSCPPPSWVSAAAPGGTMATDTRPSQPVSSRHSPCLGPSQLRHCPEHRWPRLALSPPGPFLSRSKSLKAAGASPGNAGLPADASR